MKLPETGAVEFPVEVFFQVTYHGTHIWSHMAVGAPASLKDVVEMGRFWWYDGGGEVRRMEDGPS